MRSIVSTGRLGERDFREGEGGKMVVEGRKREGSESSQLVSLL